MSSIIETAYGEAGEGGGMSAVQRTLDLVRGFYDTMPKGSRYYLTTMAKDAAGLLDRHRLHDAIEELREAAIDESVGRITILILYDTEADERAAVAAQDAARASGEGARSA